MNNKELIKIQYKIRKGLSGFDRYRALEKKHQQLVVGLLHYGASIPEDKAYFHMRVLAKAIGKRKEIGRKYGYLRKWELELDRLQRDSSNNRPKGLTNRHGTLYKGP